MEPTKRYCGCCKTGIYYPIEIPLDYRERRMQGRIHCADNTFWIFDTLPKRTVTLRAFLLDAKINRHAALFNAVYDKIKVKTYLTDRVLTGDHKTNREKRWETHPASVHFALRRTCMEIEYPKHGKASFQVGQRSQQVPSKPGERVHAQGSCGSADRHPYGPGRKEGSDHFCRCSGSTYVPPD
jgi:hypothetical protein